MARPLAGENGLWTLFYAIGMPGSQPSAIKAQGPFHGPLVAEGMLQTIAGCLAQQGHIEAVDSSIRRLYLQSEPRRPNGE